MKSNFVIFLSSACLLSIFTAFFIKPLNLNLSNIPQVGCRCFNFSGDIDYSQEVAVFEGNRVTVPRLAFENTPPYVLGSVNAEKWIEVDLSEQMLWAWEGDRLFLETKISSGLPQTPTPQGVFNIWVKLRSTKMEGGKGRYYYYLPNVPYVMFFQNEEVPGWKGYGLHGTYWHNDFGRPRSHGCVNLPTEMAKQLYYWTSPVLPEGKNSVFASAENPGTKIVIHE
jgi:hypothetical protein